MSAKEWLGGKKGWDFIRENNNIMSPAEMADYFGITTEELTREKFEMGITVDEDGSNSEYELRRCLNRFERAHTWGLDTVPEKIAINHRPNETFFAQYHSELLCFLNKYKDLSMDI